MLPAIPSMTVALLAISSLTLRRQIRHNSFVKSANPVNGSHYDYIVVGAGSAGCVVAARLADAKPNATVLLVEAGGPQSVITDMPGNTLFLVGGEFDWNYHVQPQQTAGLAYPDFFISRGKVLGGSSVTNWDIYNRGNPRDYDNWSTRYGLTNMTWNRVLPYFLLWENNTDTRLLTSGLHSNRGLISVSTETEPDPVVVNFERTMNLAGLPTVDINGPTQLGTTIAQMFWNADSGIKSTTANSYIETRNRTNLTILTRSFVERILLNNASHVHGIVYSRNGSTYVAHADREIILSAGPINTPQVLMLSGIGPRDHLSQLGITTVRDLAVGNNLHDMVFVPLYYRVNNPNQVKPFPAFNAENLYNYFANSSGPLAHHPDGVTYYSSGRNPDTSWPDTMIISVVEFFNNLNATVAQYNSNQEEWRQYWEPYAKLGYYLAIDPVLARPRSRGTVRLNRTNPLGPPLVDPRYLSAEEDFEAIFDATKFAVEAIRRFPLPYVTEFPPIPTCAYCVDRCDDYLRCHIRNLARSYYNFVGTARMGLPNDTEAVVDPEFRVQGFNNLRVVDASVIPEIPNAHTNAATLMLAEKAARLIITAS